MRCQVRKMLCVLLVLALLLVTTPAALASGSSAKVNSSSARFYKSSSTSSASVKLKKGVSATVKDIDDDWAKVTISGKTGYVLLKNLTLSSGVTAYIREDTHMYKSASSSSARTTISCGRKIRIIGISGSYYHIKVGSTKAYVRTSSVSKNKVSGAAASSSGSTSSSGSSTFKSNRSKVVMMDWFDGGSDVLKVGSYGTIYDVKTGITVRIKRMGGHNHADVEPATKSDTAKLLKIAGGTFSWDSHAVILHAGNKYVACGINTLPHGDQTLKNNGYNGQFCLHMSGSLTHCSGSANENHQHSIEKAFNWAHS